MRNLQKIFLWSLIASCGVEVGNPKNPTGDEGDAPKNQPDSVVVKDDDVAIELVSGSIDEVTNALASTNSATTTTSSGLMLTNTTSPAFGLASDFDRDLSCASEGEKKLKVSRKLSGTRRYEVGRRLRALVVEETGSGEQSLTFSSDTNSLSCNSGKTKALVDWRSIKGLNLAVSFKREFSQKVTRKINSEVQRDSYFKAEGERNFKWTEKSNTDSRRIVSGELTKKLTRDVRVTTKRSGKTEISSAIETNEALTITNEYDLSSGSWQKRTISTGKITATQTDKSRVVLNYKDVVYEPSGGCTPTSGSISGEVFDQDDEETPFETFEVSFAGDNTTVVFNDGTSKTYEAAACDFE